MWFNYISVTSHRGVIPAENVRVRMFLSFVLSQKRKKSQVFFFHKASSPWRDNWGSAFLLCSLFSPKALLLSLDLLRSNPASRQSSCLACVLSSGHVGLCSEAFVIEYAPASLCRDLMKYVSTQRGLNRWPKNTGSFDVVLVLTITKNYRKFFKAWELLFSTLTIHTILKTLCSQISWHFD